MKNLQILVAMLSLIAAPTVAYAQDGADGASLEEFQALLRQLEQLERYNEALTAKIAIQEALVSQKRAELEKVDELKPAVRALLEQMTAEYADLVENDMPFDMAERAARVARYQGQLGAEDADSNIAQNYRLLLEALQIELDAGRAVVSSSEVYLDDNGQEVLDRDGEPEKLEYLRVGRVAYIRRNENLKILDAWNQRTREWESLPASYGTGLDFGYRVAREQAAPGVMFIPVLPPQ